MQTTKLSDFLKQQGDTPQGKSVYQAFIDNFDENFDADYGVDASFAIARAFWFVGTTECVFFWVGISNKWQQVENPENDMLWLLYDEKPPKETDGEDELEERRRKEVATPTEQPPILPIGTNQLLDTEETKELDEAAKAIDPFGYYENMGKTTKQEKQPVSLFNSTSDGYSVDSKRKQIGGDHYAKHTIQPWDIIREYKLDFFEGSCLKYLLRRKDNRLEDLQKAAHYLEECIKNEQKRIENE